MRKNSKNFQEREDTYRSRKSNESNPTVKQKHLSLLTVVLHFYTQYYSHPLSGFFSSFRSEATMEPAEKDLLKMAEKLESEKLPKIKFNSTHMIDLDGLICDIYARRCPKPIEYHNRRDLIRIFNVITKEIYGNGANSPVVEEFGSFVMDIFNEKSDIDLSINFSNSIEVTRQKKIETLRKFSSKLRSLQKKGHVTGLQVILSAKVPIIKVTDSGTGIECDLSVENRDGIAKSHIIHAISAIDERFRKLSYLMKSWAKAHNINSSKDQTLNSLSIILFVAFHLQTCDPPILPPFSALLKEGDDPESVTKIVKTYINYGKQNRESLAKLFVTLFVKLASAETLWQKGFCASSYEGSWILKSWKRPYSISIEDFTDRSQNVARAVGTKQVKTIYKCIHKSLNYLTTFLKGQFEGINLMDQLFGTHPVPTLEVGGTSNIRENKHNLPTLQNPHPSKKRRVVEGLGENLAQKPSENNSFVQDLHGTQPQGMGWMQQPLVKTVHNALASFTPPVPYQHSLPNPRTNINVHHGCGPRNVPPPPFGLNPLVFDGSYNPSLQSHLVSSQGSLGFVQTFHQKAVAPNPYRGSFKPSSSHNLLRRDHTFYNQRSD